MSPTFLCRTLLLGSAVRTALSETFVGFVVDNFCWDMPDHRGIDGSWLGVDPGSHILHCFWDVRPCRDSGYVLLEELASATPEGYVYGPRHQLDDAGDELMYQLARTEQERAGDRRFDDLVTVTGTLVGDEIAVTEVCITPAHRNQDGETFCQRQGASEARSTSSLEATTRGTTAGPSSTTFFAPKTTVGPRSTTFLAPWPEPEPSPESTPEPEAAPETTRQPAGKPQPGGKPMMEPAVESTTWPSPEPEPESTPEAEAEPAGTRQPAPEFKPMTDAPESTGQPPAEPEPEPESTPEAEAESESTRQPSAESEPESTPEAEAEPESTRQPAPEPEPESTPEAEAEPESTRQPAPEPEPESTPEAEAEPESTEQTSAEPEPESTPEAEAEPESTRQPAPEPEPETTPDPVPDTPVPTPAPTPVGFLRSCFGQGADSPGSQCQAVQTRHGNYAEMSLPGDLPAEWTVHFKANVLSFRKKSPTILAFGATKLKGTKFTNGRCKPGTGWHDWELRRKGGHATLYCDGRKMKKVAVKDQLDELPAKCSRLLIGAAFKNAQCKKAIAYAALEVSDLVLIV